MKLNRESEVAVRYIRRRVIIGISYCARNIIIRNGSEAALEILQDKIEVDRFKLEQYNMLLQVYVDFSWAICFPDNFYGQLHKDVYLSSHKDIQMHF
jgi:hypothetical protein